MGVVFPVVAGTPDWIGQDRMGLHGSLKQNGMLVCVLHRFRRMAGVGVVAAQPGPVSPGNGPGGGLGIQAQH